MLAECCRQIAVRLLRSRDAADAERAIKFVQRGLSILDAGVPAVPSSSHWQHHLESLWGKALLVQNKFNDGEAKLLSGYEGLANAPRTGESYRDHRTREALERIVRMYDAWHLAEPGKGFDSKAAEWRSRLESASPTTAPSSQP